MTILTHHGNTLNRLIGSFISTTDDRTSRKYLYFILSGYRFVRICANMVFKNYRKLYTIHNLGLLKIDILLRTTIIQKRYIHHFNVEGQSSVNVDGATYKFMYYYVYVETFQ